MTAHCNSLVRADMRFLCCMTAATYEPHAGEPVSCNQQHTDVSGPKYAISASLQRLESPHILRWAVASCQLPVASCQC
jgi:hypothetical protein